MKLLYAADDLIRLKKEMSEIKNVVSIKIATAFLSSNEDMKIYLLDISKNNNILKNNYEIFLSEDFSPIKKYEILKFLESFATVYIIPNLHAKVYWLLGDKELLSFGSANLTNNGFGNNLELMCIADDTQKYQAKEFFDYCRLNSILVNQNNELLNLFNELDKETKKIEDNDDNKKVKDRIDKIKHEIEKIKQMGNKTKYEYKNLEGYFFQKEDYEIFNNENAKKNDLNTNVMRDVVKNKLLEINDDIKVEIEKRFDLHNHYRKENIISPFNARPSLKFNNNRLNWLGIRYGRTEKEIRLLNSLSDFKDKDEIYGFQKYTCFQFNLSYENIIPFLEIGIFHSVPKRAVDRDNLREKMLYDENLNLKIMQELNKLKGNELVWTAFEEKTEMISEFNIDKTDSSEFRKWYLNNVDDGKYSSLLFKILPDNIKIKSKEDIEQLILNTINLLKPLYDLIIWKANKL